MSIIDSISSLLLEDNNDLNPIRKDLESLCIGLECFNDFNDDYISNKENNFPELFDFLNNPRTVDFTVGFNTKTLINKLEKTSFLIFGKHIVNFDMFVKKLCFTFVSILIEEPNIDTSSILNYLIETIPTFEDVFSVIVEKKNAGSFSIDEEDEDDGTELSNSDFSVSEGSHAIGSSKEKVESIPKTKLEKAKANANYQLQIKKLQQNPSIKAFLQAKNKINSKNVKVRNTYVSNKGSVYNIVDLNIKNLIVHRNSNLLKSIEDALTKDIVDVIKSMSDKSIVKIDDVDISTLDTFDKISAFFNDNHKTIEIDNNIIDNSNFGNIFDYAIMAVKAKKYNQFIRLSNSKDKNLFIDDFNSAVQFMESEIKTIRYNPDRIAVALQTKSAISKKNIENANKYLAELEILLRLKDIKSYFYNLDKNIKLTFFNVNPEVKSPNDYIHFVPDAVYFCRNIINSIIDIQKSDYYNKYLSKYEFINPVEETNEDLPTFVPIYKDRPIMVKKTKLGNYIYELNGKSMYYDKLNSVLDMFNRKLSTLESELSLYFPEKTFEKTSAIINSSRDIAFFANYTEALTANVFYHKHISLRYIINKHLSVRSGNVEQVLNKDKTKIINKDILYSFKYNFNYVKEFIEKTEVFIKTIANQSIISTVNNDIMCLKRLVTLYEADNGNEENS
jgi:hypothetical protein